MEFIDLKTQYIRYKESIDLRIQRVLQHGQYVLGPEIFELETALAQFVGVKHCITVASGTDSLEIALRALQIGPGDEVITVPFTWISTAEVISLVGARPVFIDIEEDTYNLNPQLLDKAITSKTKAIIPVNLFGQMADYRAINAIAARHKIPVIEDAAQSFGSKQDGNRSCGVTLIGSTSFFPAKPLGCYGDGGALFTNDADMAERMRAIHNHGGLQRHHHYLIGMNGRFDTIQAAVILAKLPYFESEIEKRIEIGNRYSNQLSDVCITPKIFNGNTHLYAQYTIRLPNRDRVSEILKNSGIPNAIYYPKCLHEQPVFGRLGYRWGDYPISEKVSREVLSLPMHPFLNHETQDLIIHTLKNALENV